MAIIKVERPKLSAGENIYFGAIFKGMIITLRHAFRSLAGKSTGAEALNSSGVGITMQYPEQKWDDNLPEYYRGAPALVMDEKDRERCVSCQLCEFICPPKAIKIIPDEIPSNDEWAKVEKQPKEFEIDMIRCIYCGMCEEACPVDAIELTPRYEITGLTRQEMIFDKAKLLEVYDQTIEDKPM